MTLNPLAAVVAVSLAVTDTTVVAALCLALWFSSCSLRNAVFGWVPMRCSNGIFMVEGEDWGAPGLNGLMGLLKLFKAGTFDT